MYWLADSWDAIIDFLYLGGNVLRWIAITIFLMWVLIIERLMFFRCAVFSLKNGSISVLGSKHSIVCTLSAHSVVQCPL